MLDLNQRDRALLEREPVLSSSSGITAGISASISTGSIPTAGTPTTELRSTIAQVQPSAAEGLSLLEDRTHEMDIAMSPESYGDVAHHLLDYDSDTSTQVDPESTRLTVPDVRQSSTSQLETERAELVPPKMDAVYYQCNAIRNSCRKETLTSVSSDSSYGKTVTIQSPSIGTFSDHEGISRTFHGSRIMKGNVSVNESISCSFDPATMTCLSCSTEHSIVSKDPILVLFSDQNFPPTLAGPNSNCINIVRLENATLSELLEIAKEIFGSSTIADGSIFMFGSASFLGSSGTSVYARDWTEICLASSNHWRGIRICPLIPLIISECPGTIVRELSELTTWFDRMYDSNPQGMRETWHCLAKAMESCSTGIALLAAMDSYKLILPKDLHSRTLDHVVTFCSNSSRPMIFKGLSKDHQNELLGTLLTCVYENYRACACPEDYLARADVPKTVSENSEQKVALCGASNLRHSVPHFAKSSVILEDITSPGWIASPENISKMMQMIGEKQDEISGYVFDLLGNSSVRFVQIDGTTSLPFKSNGRFHMGGNVTVTPPQIFKKLVDSVIPIFKAKGNKPCVIIPPIPRCLFSRCCSDDGHCTNVNDSNFVETMVTGFLRQRTELIRQLVQSGLTNFRVLDSCCTTNCVATASISERIAALQKTTWSDGIHYTKEGYHHLAERTLACLKVLIDSPKNNTKKGTYFWRGFRSQNGSTMPRPRPLPSVGTQHAAQGGRMRGMPSGRSRAYHPYKRW
jgi:hypothetical protein